MEDSKQYTEDASKWLSLFIKDLYKNKDKILNKVDEYPLGNHDLIKEAILHGPSALPQTDEQVAADMFNFIEFYATGKFKKVKAEYQKELLKDAK